MKLTSTLAIAALAASVPLQAQGQEQFRLSGDEVAIYNLAGSVEVIAGSGNDVVVEMTRGGDDGGELTVDVGNVRGRTALRVMYPSDRVVYRAEGRRNSSTNVRVRDDGTFYDDAGSRGRRVEVRSRGRGLQAHADLTVRVPAGRSVAIYLAAGESEAEGLDANLRMDVGSGAVRVHDIRGWVEVDTGSGSVTLDNVQGEHVSIDTGSGSVDFGRVRADVVTVDTGSGSVEGSNLLAGRLNVDTGSGGIELMGVESTDVVLDTGSGRVEVDFDSDVDRLEVDTGSGSITVHLPESAGAEFEIDSGSGGIDLDATVRLEESARSYARGELGDGVGSIRLDTGSGRIRLATR